MRFLISKAVSGFLAMTLVVSPALVRAASDEAATNAQAVGVVNVVNISRSIERAAGSAAATLAPSNATNVPLSLPRSSRVKKGMGTGMMIMSLVGTAAGLAGTYYMLKTIKDQTKPQTGS